MEENERKMGSGNRSAVVRDLAETLLLTCVVFLAINATTGRFFIDGNSMEPTLHDGQYIVVSKLVYELAEPGRGDIVVLQYPHDLSRNFIKRVIGVPGDEVVIDDGELIINGSGIEEPYIGQVGSYSGQWTLGPDELFVLGDNRNNSSDSHSWGVLPRENVLGRAWVIYWPPQDWGIAPHIDYDLAHGTAHAAGE